MLHVTDQWVWDFWLADDGHDYHLFFLQAPRGLGDPDLRHHHASVGHAVSSDLSTWARLPDALAAGPEGAFDDRAIWTGSVVRGPAGGWFMFYTGLSLRGAAHVQQIGLATSTDLISWTKHPMSPVVRADDRWYETSASRAMPDDGPRDQPGGDETWRDPWVFPDPGGAGWHMLVTARARSGAPDDRGVVGHARSSDLLRWEVQPPLSAPGSGFAQLEVLQVQVVDGTPVLLFSCLRSELATTRAARADTGGVWAVAAPRVLGPYPVSDARRLTDDTLYSGRLVLDRGGQWNLLAFRNRSESGFVGQIIDPLPVTVATRPSGERALYCAQPA